ncbi:MAG: M23 family metallopeptidase [Deltaproteobacteria bacterium]|nr:M23 family metallopeptidase [Deltaproteobacteria bacterium]MBW2253367.1 M23 family metallopeptidase [Deltaproteobacteria bacterium]
MSEADPGTTGTAPPSPPAEPISITPRQLRRLRWLVGGLIALVMTLALSNGLLLMRNLAYQDLFEENLALRQRLVDIDRKMTQVDRLMLRLRLYDAEFRSLGDPSGDHGPLTDDALLDGEGGVDPMEQDPQGGMGLGPEDLRPAEVWADAVQARVETFLSLAVLSEPDLTALMAELEDLRALQEALPSDWPADGRMTSGFGWRRSPFGRTWRFHSGLDISNRRGTPIRVAAPGRVVKAGYNSGYGRMVEIDHGFGITTLYAHCNSVDLREGDVVERGQYLGTIGSTGRSTGPHLHFEVRLDGHPVDPLDYLPR